MAIETLSEKLLTLPQYIIQKLLQIVDSYEKEREKAEDVSFEYCPKCNTYHPFIIKGGKTKGGKQMYRCKHCGKRFTVDIGSFTYYSHISKEQWNECIKLSIQGASLLEITESLGVSETTAFNMRHKLMYALGRDQDPVVIKGSAEFDEKYLQKSHKGTKIAGVPSKKRGTKAGKGGLSNEKICLLTVTERGANSFLRAFNMAKPSSEDVLNLAGNIAKETFMWTDGLSSYEALAKECNSRRMVLLDKEDYDKANHLNTVNSFHSQIEKWNEQMRGVASKYINRYASLFNIRWISRGKDISEALLFINSRIANGRNSHFSVIDLKTSDLFQPSELAWSA